MFKIIYGDSDPFQGIAPTPFVSRGVSTIFNAQEFADVNRITLNGIVTGCDPDENEWSGTYERTQMLVNNFGESFQKLTIAEELGEGATGIVFSEGYARISNISFDGSVFAGNVPFTITLDVYDEASFAEGTYGITQPSQNESYEDEGNGQINFTRVTSAKGFRTDQDAVDNARVFVQGITGSYPTISPLMVSASGSNEAVLLGVTENIDRLQGSYSVTETWAYNSIGNINNNSIYNYTVDVKSGNNAPSVNIQGNIIGQTQEDMSLLREDFRDMDILALAEEAYSNAGFSGELNAEPMSRSISEERRRIQFNYEYTDQFSGDPYVIDRFRVNSTFTQPKRCIKGSVSIRSNVGCINTRWERVNEFYNDFDPMAWVSEKMASYGYDFEIPSQPASISTQFNEKRSSIDVSVGVCEALGGIPSGFNQFDYSINVTPAQPKFAPYQGINCSGHHIVQKLNGLDRKTVDIQGNGVKNSCVSQEDALTSLNNFINTIKSDYLSGTDTFMTRDSTKFGDTKDPNNLSFNFGWNEEDILRFDSGIFQGVESNNLSLNNNLLTFEGNNLSYNS